MTYGSAIIIVNAKGELLLQHRDENAPEGKNTWAMWGGGQEGSETPVEVAVRELKEELAVEVKESDLELYKKFLIKREGVEDKEVSVFILEDDDSYRYELHEGDGFHFFTAQEIKRLPLNFTAKPVLAEYLGFVA